MNKSNALRSAATEWGKARKWEARERGLDATAARENIAEQLNDMTEED